MTFSEQMWREPMIPWVGHWPGDLQMSLQTGDAGHGGGMEHGFRSLCSVHSWWFWEALLGAAVVFACPASIPLLLLGTYQYCFGGSTSYPLSSHVVQVRLTVHSAPIMPHDLDMSNQSQNDWRRDGDMTKSGSTPILLLELSEKNRGYPCAKLKDCQPAVAGDHTCHSVGRSCELILFFSIK